MRAVVCCGLILALGVIGCGRADDNDNSFCGAVIEDQLVNPVNEDLLEDATVIGNTGGNVISIKDSDGRGMLILLQGTKPSENAETRAVAENFINSLGTKALVIVADSECTDSQGELRELVPGQIYTPDGFSYSEMLLRRGLVEVDDGQSCSGDLIVNCLNAVAVAG